MRRTRVVRSTLAVAALGLVALGCAKTEDTSSAPTTTVAPDPVPGGALAFGLTAEPGGFDPSSNPMTPASWMIAKAVYDPLVAMGTDGKAHPFLAQSLEPNADFTVWTIKLREGITFHDGTPLDAQAVVTNLEDRRKGVVSAQALTIISKVAAVDPLTVEVTMASPWANFPIVMTDQIGFIVAPSTITGAERTAAVKPVGTGPFVFKDWQKNQSILATKNPQYWMKDAKGRSLPYLEEVEFKVLPDSASRIAGLTTGDLNAFHAPEPPIAAKFLRGELPDLKFDVDRNGGDELFITLNMAGGPFTDRKLREAAVRAIDRNDLNAKLFGGQLELANGPYPEGSTWGASTTYPGYDAEAAKALVAEVGGGAPIPVKLTMINTTDYGLIANYLKERWDAVGFSVTIETVDETPFAARAVTGASDAFAFPYWYAVDPDGLWHLLTSQNAKPNGEIGLNFARWKSPTVDQAIDDGRRQTDVAARQADYQKVWDEMGRDLPYFFLVHNAWTIAWSPTVHNMDTLTLPDGAEGDPFIWGNSYLTQVWLSDQ